MDFSSVIINEASGRKKTSYNNLATAAALMLVVAVSSGCLGSDDVLKTY